MIELIGVSKKFRIWEDRSRDLKETAINFLKGKKRSFREIWALRDIGLTIREGETVGFIGKNGSGKSTLLKLLAGIYAPDEGKVISRGKISTLLELGVGFHPDLTGEENVYLNGAMLGFDEEEMRDRFDEIVSFSEIGNFIYSPIRTYSSGMLMRLGFSIATCVNPDILLVDEILAVGDEAFQEKSLERMETFKEAGKTILLVSHSMETVQKFCTRAVLLSGGRVVWDDIPEKTIDAYHEALYGPEYFMKHPQGEEPPQEEEPAFLPERGISEDGATAEGAFPEEEKGPEAEPQEVIVDPTAYRRFGTFEAEVRHVSILNDAGEEVESFISGERASVRIHIQCHEDLDNPAVGMILTRFDQGWGSIVYNTNTQWRGIDLGALKRDDEIEVRFEQIFPLGEGTYYLNVGMAHRNDSKLIDWHENRQAIRISMGEPGWEGAVNLNSRINVFKLSSSSPPSEKK